MVGTQRWIWGVVAVLIVALVGWPAMGQGRPTIDGKIGAGEYAKTFAHPKSKITMTWTIAGDTIFIGLQATAEGWVGVNLLGTKTEKKKGADSYLFTTDGGQGVAMDLFQKTPTKRPVLDEEAGGKNSILEFAVSRSGEAFVAEFSRKLNTGEPTDMQITPGKKFVLSMAVGPEENWKKEHKKSRRWAIEAFSF
jgi:hypothetical protein